MGRGSTSRPAPSIFISPSSGARSNSTRRSPGISSRCAGPAIGCCRP